MPSPFLGMDPFLEDAEIFPDLHDSLIVHLRDDLMSRLPVPYYALVGSRVWIEPAHRRVGPDVRIHRGNGSRGRGRGNGAATAIATKPVVVTVPYDEIRETFVDIYTGPIKRRRLITSIEILSPTNKTPGEQGRDKYQEKQSQLRADQVNLVEIDLLRGGTHTTLIDKDVLAVEVGACDYHVCCWRAERFNEYSVYPIQLCDPLPVIAIPLLPGDAGIEQPLQLLFDQVYDAGPYSRMVDYRDPIPRPPLSAEKRKWVLKCLADAGVRKRR